MRKNLSAKVTSVALTAAMAMTVTACGGSTAAPAEPAAEPAAEEPAAEAPAAEEPAAEATEAPAEEEEVSPYTVLKDADGNPIDLGGIDVVIRDWWTGEDNEMTNPKNELDEARKEYREWAMETYNFNLVQQQISDWGSTPADFVDYVTTGGDDTNYVWIVRDSPEIAGAMASGLLYDLSKTGLDFNDEFFTANKVNEQYTYKGGVYAMYNGMSEPRNGLWINEQILKDANVDVNTIYDAQKNDTWTWDMFKEVMDQVQKDTDNDGTNDIWGFTGNTGGAGRDFIAANGGEVVGSDANGYVLKLTEPQAQEGLQFTIDLLGNYYMPRPEGAQWDYYKEEFLNGTVAFCYDGEYCGNPGGQWADASFPLGFVMIPKGPQGKLTNIWSNNPVVIPSCYDDDRAQKLAYAFYIWNQPVPGFEDNNGFVTNAESGAVLDDRGCEETIPMMSESKNGMITYDQMIPGLDTGAPLFWNVAPGADASALIDAVVESYQTAIDTANGK